MDAVYKCLVAVLSLIAIFGATSPVFAATGVLLNQQTDATNWALLVIVLAALGITAIGLVVRHREK